ncbi:Glycosyltransferase involved in cell wall bisynthesis [Lachnospiraceae bacterium]|nr:Glycosyltransferase involved in cell wall bisynthesis [Lachnospiraceae bacterium]
MDIVREYKPLLYGDETPFFSIIIVSYNYEKTILRALEAIKNQTYDKYQIVLVDNGSTDNTNEIIQKFIQNNKDLYITHIIIEKNEGLPKGRNLGIKNACGKYLIFNDADDWMDRRFLEIIYKASRNGCADRISVQFRDVSPEGKVLQVRNYVKGMSPWYITLLQGNAFRRDIFVKNNILVPDTFEDDLYISLQVLGHAKRCVIVRKTLYNYYVNNNSTSGINSITEKERIGAILDDVINCVDPVRRIVSHNNWEYLEYQMIKCYYNLIFNYNRNRSYKDISDVYHYLNNKIKKYDANYLNNKKIKLSFNGDRIYGRLLTYFFVLSERLHVMVPILWMYIFLSKILYFNV